MEQEYYEYTIQLSKLYQELFSFRIDWATGQIFPPPQPIRGLFGKIKSYPAEYLERKELIRQIKELQYKIQRNKDQYHLLGTNYWWELDCIDVENFFIQDVLDSDKENGWNFDIKLEAEKDGNFILLFIAEEGHKSRFNGESDESYFKTSNYSSEERNKILQKYDEKIADNELYHLYFDSDTMVYSSLTNTLYDSYGSYYVSGEYYCEKSSARQKLEDSLYTEHQVNSLSVRSNSIHYKIKSLISAFRVNDHNEIDSWTNYPFIVKSASGDITDEVIARQKRKNAALESAVAFALSDGIVSVNLNLFRDALLKGTKSIRDAFILTEILAVLAEKIRY